MPQLSSRKPKHLEVLESLQQAIENQSFQVGDRLPGEHELVKQFQTSRPTIARALRELQHLGLIERRVGSGTYVRAPQTAEKKRKLFGLLIPDLGQTEVLEPICGQLAREVQAAGHGLLWGDFTDVATRARKAEQACHSYVEQHVAGVLFAPIELEEDAGQTNQHILDELTAARIPVVLIDRDVARFPERSPFDLVGIDNLRAGYLLARHLLDQGRRRIAFLARPASAPTVDRRISGYREAMSDAGLPLQVNSVHLGDPREPTFVRGLLESKPDAVICANDITAALLLQTLGGLAVRVPDDVAVVGFDDVKYAKLLHVPLTTMRQPCRELGTVAARALLERMTYPDLPPRTILLEPQLVVRKSCGTPEKG